LHQNTSLSTNTSATSQIQSHDIIGFVETVADGIVFFVDYLHAEVEIEIDCLIELIDIQLDAGIGR
jgi:hypothetical protein